jgi:hypothetical protein
MGRRLCRVHPAGHGCACRSYKEIGLMRSFGINQFSYAYSADRVRLAVRNDRRG